jgi:hypothetical protein
MEEKEWQKGKEEKTWHKKFSLVYQNSSKKCKRVEGHACWGSAGESKGKRALRQLAD